MEFLDAHQHLILRDRFGYDWTADIPALDGDFTLDDYNRQAAGTGIIGSIFMESGVNDADYQNEARFIASLLKKQSINGMRGQVVSCRPEEDEASFDAWIEECDRMRVKGFRRILHVMPDELSQSPRFRANLKKIGRLGFAFDLCVLARQLPLATELVRDCDEQRFVLDHCGGVGCDFDGWRAALKEFASLDHVLVKLSGITAHCSPDAISMETLKPWVDHVLELFGSRRIIWGGDWPVVNLGSGLPGWVELSRQLIAHLSSEEQRDIAQTNARIVYYI